jgi:hypothetical protein
MKKIELGGYKCKAFKTNTDQVRKSETHKYV